MRCFGAFTVAPLLAGLVLITVAGTVQAGFDCEKYWKGPSANNQISQCHIEKTYQGRYGQIIPPAIAALILVFTLLCFPFIWTCRQCCKCCGSNRRRPGVCCCGGSEWDEATIADKEAEYSPGEVTYTKGCTVVVALISLVCMICMIVGGAYLAQVYQGFFDKVYGVVDWGDQQIDFIELKMTLPDGSFVAGFPESALEGARNGTADLRRRIDKMKKTGDKYEAPAEKVGLAVGIVPMLLPVFGLLMALGNCRTCGPAFLNCWYFLFIIVYSLLGITFLVVGAVSKDLCDEIDLQLEGKPGFFQWYLVPQCEVKLDFGTIESSVQDAERTNSISGCDNFKTICSASPVWSSAAPNKIYVCNIVNSTAQCDTLAKLVSIVGNVTGKTGTFTMCKSVPNNQCDLAECAADCVVATNKDNANQTLTALDSATRSLDAYTSYVKPLLNCSNIVDVALRPFGECRKLVRSFNLMGGGATGYCAIFVFAIWVMFRGQKRFFSKSAAPGGAYTEVIPVIGEPVPGAEDGGKRGTQKSDAPRGSMAGEGSQGPTEGPGGKEAAQGPQESNEQAASPPAAYPAPL